MAEYLKLLEVARRLDVSEKTARRMVRSGKLPAVFIGGAYRVSEEDLEKFLQDARVAPGKVGAPPSPRERSFNDLLEEERRLNLLRGWVEYLSHTAERWERSYLKGAVAPNLALATEMIEQVTTLVGTVEERVVSRGALRPEEIEGEEWALGDQVLEELRRLLNIAGSYYLNMLEQAEVGPLKAKGKETNAVLEALEEDRRRRSAG